MVILKTYETIVDSTWGFNWIAFVPLTIGLLLLAIGIKIFIGQKDPPGIVIILGGLVFSFLTVSVFANATPVYETRYDIYVEEDVPLQEVVEKYDIIEIDGLTLTVRDKAPE